MKQKSHIDSSFKALAGIFLVAFLSVGIAFGASASVEQQRKVFLDASHALQSGQTTKFKNLLNELADYPVTPYLEYDYFRRYISRISLAEAREFLDRYDDFPFAYHARGKLLNRLAKKQDWDAYLSFFDGRDNTRLQCLAFKARLQQGVSDDQMAPLLDEIATVWNRGYSQPSACDPAFAFFLKNRQQVDVDIWQRIEKAFAARRPKLARYLGKKLPESERPRVELWYKAHVRPESTLRASLKQQPSSEQQPIILHGLDRQARKDALVARELWGELQNRFEFSSEEQAQIDRRIALSAAYQHLPEARQLLVDLPAESKNDQAHLWLARMQIRSADWLGLVKTIEEMPEHLREENEWQYWLARSLESDGQLQRSMSMLQDLAQKTSYYGFLSADKLRADYVIQQQAVVDIEFDEDLLLEDNPNLLRARELFFLDRIVDAKREWFQAMRKLDQQQIKKAAVLASRWKWYDSAIRTVAKTPHRSDYALRFPTPYKNLVMENAELTQLDPSVIYGIMRRESLFDPLARSSAGALGLMQLMPGTARVVARSLGLKKPRKADILSVSNNIRLGTSYFRTVMNRFDNNVTLAAAAYNAGPNNVRRWLPKSDVMESDLWVETVPFRETRDYVKAVLAYSTVFDKSFGNPTTMSTRMLPVKSVY